MSISQDPFFHAFFNASTPRLILQANPPDFTICSYNQTYAELTHSAEKDLAGLPLFQVFDPKIAGGNGAEILLDVLKQAVDKKAIVNTGYFQYDSPTVDQKSCESNWWQLEIIPVFGNTDAVTHLMVTTNNVNHLVLAEASVLERDKTEQRLNEELEKRNTDLSALNESLSALNEELSALNEELSASNEELRQSEESLQQINTDLEDIVAERVKALKESETTLRNLVSTVHHPLMLLKGKDWVVEIANQQLGRTLEQIFSTSTG